MEDTGSSSRMAALVWNRKSNLCRVSSPVRSDMTTPKTIPAKKQRANKMCIRDRGDIVLLSVVFSMLSGTVFGVYPAYKAAKLDPVDALRQDS